jgi:RNase P subunit RPR2
MSEILIDTALGGHCCDNCGRPLLPDEDQCIIGRQDGLYVICEDCLSSAEVWSC